ncbi:MAG: DUF1080 domain-containing protein [Acidobacteria bacterium]|nr:DUF1080 domain-containing protein [Acidobacteriota bacterium]
MLFAMLMRWMAISTALAAALSAQTLPPKKGQVWSKDGKSAFGYKDTPVQPWSGFHVHDPDRPIPPKVDPAGPGGAPSDAIVLFDGADLSAWQPSTWKVENGYAEVTEGALVSKQEFGDCQVHVEYRTPAPPEGEVMNRGNSGVNLMGIFEIQITDSYTVPLNPDGRAGAIYGQTPPMADATRAPGEWQSYDIFFRAPRFENGKLSENPRVTLVHNGVLAHFNQEIYGATGHRRLPQPIPAGLTKGPLLLGGHHNPVRFRNIWVREIGELH